MRYMTSAEIRDAFIKFFEEKGCQHWPSSSLIPDDPSLLLTSAGMVQFKPYFLQQKHLDPQYIGTTTAQKCVRTTDIDIIGTTGRHLSFFEMLGNFSFGRYFKKEMCAWAYEFSTEVLGLPAERLYYTVFEDDDETIEIWKSLGVPDSHISRLGEEDNFWRAGPTGPCGPCSELYYDQGPEVGCGREDCAPGCDCDRFLEYWNCVFTQFDGQEDGTLVPLPKKNIDTGMGLERIAAILQGVTTNYETDIMRSLIAVGEKLVGCTYGEDEKTDLSLRIMADHSRSVTFMIADGILPSNEGRGYVLRRLLRRAVMKAYLLGVEGPFLSKYIAMIVDLMGDVYHEIVSNRALIERVVLSEEERFGATLRQGSALIDEQIRSVDSTVLDGEIAFELHDTYGFPVEVTQEICAEHGLTVDMEGFERCMAEQKERARANAKDADAAWSTYDGSMSALLERVGATKFVGYEQASSISTVKALLHEGQAVSKLTEGQEGSVVLDVTPFYAEMGGQVGDTGTLIADGLRVEVLDTKTPEKGLTVHNVKVEEGTIEVGEIVNAVIDFQRRLLISRNHTATHILHAALRRVLGDHVKQAGSYVGPDRLRFDFTHFEAMTKEEIAEVERLANKTIMMSLDTVIYETSLDEARKAGVTALFGEKYGDVVRVVEVGDFSKELCGGCHVSNIAEIGLVKIVSESSVGSNLRRIEALTSAGALEYFTKVEDELQRTATALHVPLFDVCDRAANTAKTLKELQTAMKRNKQRIADDKVSESLGTVVESKAGYPVIIGRAVDMDASMMRNAWDILRSRMDRPGAAVIACDSNGKALLLAAGTDEAVAAGFNAGAIIKEIAPLVKGGGGGKPTMAQAGGKDASGIDAALEAARGILL